MELVPDGTEEFILDGELYVLLPNPDVYGPGMLAKLRVNNIDPVYEFLLDGRESYFLVESQDNVVILRRYDRQLCRSIAGWWTHDPTEGLDFYISHGKWHLTMRSNSRLELIDE